jgi:Holliday junction resolvase RusA-like endonuclease
MIARASKAARTVEFRIPMPPSTNALYRNVSATERARAALRNYRLPGRAKTKVYTSWRKSAWVEMLLQCVPLPRFDGEVELEIDLPPGIDADNTKAIPDLLQTLGIIRNDNLITRQTTCRIEGDRAWCVVRITEDMPA